MGYRLGQGASPGVTRCRPWMAWPSGGVTEAKRRRQQAVGPGAFECVQAV